jgi:hypothetical protein
MKPVRPAVPVGGSIAFLLVFEWVASNSGSGWVQALETVLIGVIVTGLIGPAFALEFTTVQCVASPADGTVGQPVDLYVKTSSRVGIRPLEPSGYDSYAGPSSFSGRRASARESALQLSFGLSNRGKVASEPTPVSADNPNAKGESSVVRLLPTRRGAYDHATLELTTASPFGILWWSRRVMVHLPDELHVGPRLGAPMRIPARDDDPAGENGRRTSATVGDPRGVRTYQSGDSRRWVHWPATAHHAELMVRDMEGPTAEPVTITVTLPREPDLAEQVAEQALGTVVALLEQGTSVILATTETDGSRIGPVADRRSTARRLARAVPGPE